MNEYDTHIEVGIKEFQKNFPKILDLLETKAIVITKRNIPIARVSKLDNLGELD